MTHPRDTARLDVDTVLSLRRSDKHYLGAGDGVLFAPPHPRWLDRPGFWDGIQYHLHRLAPAFTFALVRADGRELVFSQITREWTPAGIAATFAAGAIRFTERRTVLAGGRIVSECMFHCEGDDALDITVVAWTALEGEDLRDRTKCVAVDDGIRFRVATADVQSNGEVLELDARLRLEPAPDGRCIAETQFSRSYPNDPVWATTPLRDHWDRGNLPDERRLSSTPPAGRTLVALGLSRKLRLEPGASSTMTIELDVQPVEERFRSLAKPPPAIARESAYDRSRSEWARFFAGAPAFDCADPYLERYFAYRWYGLRLNAIEPAGAYAFPTCTEGTDFFHNAVAYSAWCHARELRWLHDPARARGTILTFLEHQRPDGSLPGLIRLDGAHPTISYFADWGGSVLAVDEVHPDRAFLESVYSPLVAYADQLERARDAERSGLYLVLDPYETGQETMSRYTAVDAAADTQHFDYRLRLKGVDITVYAYRLRRALARIAATLGIAPYRQHDDVADRIADAVRSRMWDADAGLFFDVDPRTGHRTGIAAAVCFYPWMTDIAGPEHVSGLERNLFDPAMFWTPVPVPSTAVSDPTFDPDGVWKGVRQNCPWNGRVWPMTNSHIAEALGLQATTHAPHLRERAADFIGRCIRMMFFDGDAARPNSFEHYSPITGAPCAWRGLDDYQHSWINDLVMRWIIGLRPTADGFMVDPLPSGIDRFRIDRIRYRGATVGVMVAGDIVSVTIDGQRRSGRLGEPLVATVL